MIRAHIGVFHKNRIVRRDHIRGAVGVRHHRHLGVISLDHLAVRIGSNREFAAAFADREFIQRFDLVVADANHRCAQGLELRRRLGKIMRLDGATFGKGRRIEIEHHRPLFQRIGQRKGELLPTEGSLGRKIRRLVAHFQGRKGRGCHQAKGKCGSGKSVHRVSPSGCPAHHARKSGPPPVAFV